MIVELGVEQEQTFQAMGGSSVLEVVVSVWGGDLEEMGIPRVKRRRNGHEN